MDNQLAQGELVENRDDGVNFVWAKIPQAAFYAEFHVADVLENTFQHRIHLIRIGQKAAAAFLVGHTWERTAHVEVNLLVTQFLALLGETQDFLRIGAEDLWGQGLHIVAAWVDFLSLQVLGVFFFVYAGEKRRVELVDAAEMPLEDIAEGRIGDALEGSQRKPHVAHFFLDLLVLAGLSPAWFQRTMLNAIQVISSTKVR